MADHTSSSIVFRLIIFAVFTQYQFIVIAFTLPRHQSSLNHTVGPPSTAFADPLLPIEEPPADADADDNAPVGDDAIDRLFEAYERQFLQNGASGVERHVRRANVGVLETEEAGSGIAPAVSGPTEIEGVASGGTVDGPDVPDTAEASALEHIATIVSDEHVLTELRKEIPAEDYVPLDVTVGETAAGVIAEVGAAVYEPVSRSHEGVIDLSTQYDVSSAHANSRTGRQLPITQKPATHNHSTAAAASSGSHIDIEIIADIPADESFVSNPAASETALSRDELLEEESLLPRESTSPQKSRSNSTSDTHELLVTIENKREASAVVLAPIADATLLEDSTNDLVAIAAAKTTPRERRVVRTQTSSYLSVEGSGEDSDEIDTEAKSKATIIDDLADNLNESVENDSNTADEHRRRGKGPKSLDEDDDDSSSDESSITRVLHSVVEAVELSTEVNRTVQSFRDAAEESSAIRQTRSRAAGRVASPSVVAEDRLLMGDLTGGLIGDGAHGSRNIVTAIMGYGCLLGVLCGTLLMVGICLAFDRVRRAGREYMIPGEID